MGARYGHLDGLVNNAAIATGIGGKTFEEIDIETWDRVMSVNVRGTWLMTKAMAPLLRKSTLGGRIVNIASDTALWGAPRLLHYVASKGAVISMTRSLARELGPDSIAVNAIAPGLVAGRGDRIRAAGAQGPLRHRPRHAAHADARGRAPARWCSCSGRAPASSPASCCRSTAASCFN